MLEIAGIDAVFRPQRVAVLGASTDPKRPAGIPPPVLKASDWD